ncbi:MAG TPA: PKD domain-containing protein, partial [Firmicutes bacterium]|nr:PKD domain-containing protein [Bacillota bacterium]
AVARLTPFPDIGVAPLRVQLNGNSSNAKPGMVGVYSWDFDGDGTADESGSDPQATHIYADQGTYSPRLAIESDHGEQAETQDEVTVYEPWAHSWGGGMNDYILAVASSDQAVYAAGSTDSFSEGSTRSGLLLKYGLDGTFHWARAWGGPGLDVFNGVAASGSSIFTVGSLNSFGAGSRDLLLQRWDEDGNLVWTRTWGKDSTDMARDVTVRGGVVYVCGKSHSMLDPIGDALLMAWDFDGNLLWSRLFGTGGFHDEAQALDTGHDFSIGKTMIYVAGQTRAYGSDNDKVLYAQFDEDGTQLSQQSWDNGDNTAGRAISVSGLFGGSRFIAAEITANFQFSGLLLEVAQDPLAVSWDIGSGTVTPYGIHRFADSLYVASYAHDQDDTPVGLLCEFSTEGALLDSRMLRAESGTIGFYALAGFPGGGLVCGGRFEASLGEWLPVAVSTTPSPILWADRETTAYDPEPLNPVTASIDQPAKEVIEGVHDTPAGESILDALVAAVEL